MRVSERGPGKPYWKMPEGLTGAGTGGRGAEDGVLGDGEYGDGVGIALFENVVPGFGLSVVAGDARIVVFCGIDLVSRDEKNALARPAPAAALATPTNARVLSGIAGAM